MRRLVLLAVVVVVAGCSSEREAAVPPTTLAPTTTTPMPPPSSATTGSTSSETTSTIAPPAATTTTTSGPVVAEAVCVFYRAFARADIESDGAEDLRRLSVALGFPRDPALSSSLDVLRGRSTERSGSSAREVLEEAFEAACPPSSGTAGGSGDGLFEAGVMVGGPNGLALLDGTQLVPPDPVGTYLAAFDDWRGGVVSLLEIGGLEVIDHRTDMAAVPRDLVLAEDARLHDSARMGGVDVGVVTVWEPAGEFGELTQNLYLAPVDGAELIPVAPVGDLLAGAESVSYAAGRFLVTRSELGGPVTIYVLDGTGERIDSAPGLPIVAGPLDDPAIEALRFARLAPDAESFAYLRNRPSPENGELRTEVVIQRLDESGDFISAEIGSPADMHTSLDFDGRYVIVTARDLLLVFDAQAGPGGELSTQPLIGAEFAYFLDSGIATAGDG